MTYFKDLGLAEPILRAVSAAGYSTPTPIQRDVIPVMMSRKDVIGIAQTGTGKTASFVLPILDRISRERNKQQPRTCGTLILTPTRELASQIADGIKAYGKFMKASSIVIVGGVKPGPQIKACARGVDVIVATPGRLLDLMQTGHVRLDQTFQVIADEADQMMDMGFLPSIRTIMKALPGKRQTVLLSATMPTQIRSLAKDLMHKPIEISVAPVSKPIGLINQIVKRVEKADKKNALTRIMNDKDITRAIVFTRTKHGANKLAIHLQKAGESVLAIHGNKSQAQREKALASFKAGNTRILVATDIAARGIDIDDVSHVINYELPNVPESYVHRIGRTARAGRSGVAISLYDTDEIKLLRDIEKLTGQTLMPASDKGGKQGDVKPAKGKTRTRTSNRNEHIKQPHHKRQVQASSRKKAPQLPRKRRPNEMRKPNDEMPSDGLMRVLGETN